MGNSLAKQEEYNAPSALCREALTCVPRMLSRTHPTSQSRISSTGLPLAVAGGAQIEDQGRDRGAESSP
jgi:hypothetical protein